MKERTSDQPPLLSDASLPAVVCVDDPERRRVVIAALGLAGFESVAEVARGLDVVTAAAENEAALVVVDLSLVGALGMRLIRVVKAACLGSEVIILTPLTTLDSLAHDAGAYAVLHEDDLRGLREAAAEISASKRAGAF